MNRRFRIYEKFCNGQTNWYDGNRSDVIRSLRFLGSIYTELRIKELVGKGLEK